MDTTLERLADEAIADLAEHGGGTYEGRTLLAFTPSSGYAVGVGGFAMKAECVTADVIAFALKAVAGEYETTYAGTWLNDGLVYFDAVLYFNHLEQKRAAAAAAYFGQQAYYDFAAKESISVA